MLQELDIRDYALIERVKIDFSPGLNILTGETGAGKSIIIGAMGLMLGERDRLILPAYKRKTPLPPSATGNAVAVEQHAHRVSRHT